MLRLQKRHKYSNSISGRVQRCWKTEQVSLYIDPNVTPVAQPLRRTTSNLRDTVESKIEAILDMDIIEPVNGPTPWVNAAVIVP